MLTENAKKAVREIAVMGCFVLAFSCAVEAAIPSASECKAAAGELPSALYWARYCQGKEF